MYRILCIDDEASIMKLYQDFLENEDLEIVVACSVRKGLEILRQYSVDLVITDMIMPEMDGIELLRSLHHVAESPPVIAVSGGGSYLNGRELLLIAEVMGVRGTLHKPFTRSELLSMVHRVLAE
ncbi:MAG: response regulator [Magnetococcales bacterium]|nr:response regulator [Magnetococcales bacterium]